MTRYLVSRHPGAWQWFAQQGIAIDRVVTHLHPGLPRTGDVVYGTLPVAVMAKLQRRGVGVYLLVLDVPAHLRGCELSAADMHACNARLEHYRVWRVTHAPVGEL
ncbi:CRISPR-associated protein Csx16 [Microbulbifer flavimaris]|uniref:CRISPR-associated protein Csx16 n=1 Tax=Microbulbifer flavimaris TaxID=1781068 RepID=A0ABX4HZU6_9GAMM|nr:MULTISPECIES: CRISPR-associated protein Csx16 [Microbulbifer]KUJ83435.1 hypothetical protein AVO43_06110 [Microbulbifer sp. ZGT114]PCO05591.1 CRISPR-associated protein Csx16 [Microbulbifer flavimaris]